MRENTCTLPSFNRGRPLRAFEKDGDIYIVDYDTGRLWKNQNVESVLYHGWQNEPELKIPAPPSHYYKEIVKNDGIGGVGATIRYGGMYKAHVDAKRKFTYCELYATNIEDKTIFLECIEVVKEYVTLGDFDDQEDEYGTAVDLTCHELEFLEVVCAQIAKTGANIVLENTRVNAFECIGAQRLDARVEDPRRASENWRYSFIPQHWGTPLLWEDMAQNVDDDGVDFRKLPQPLQQHVIRFKLKTTTDRSQREELQTFLPCKRWVAGALTLDQTRQGNNAFYKLYVEQTRNPMERKLAEAILWNYLFRRGYSWRWIGKYNQTTMYLGNGTKIRKFKTLRQYDPERLPICVLNTICKPGGKLRGRGNKGSRSKYAEEDKKYKPKRRMKRPADWMQRMRSEPVIGQKEEDYVNEDSDDEWE
jgi:hypothetical protein